ncbi:MAG: hypothetical protein QG639_637 [Patescibacteria group bacterium]|nr:hypothetical protein [Patescibacteria group bacterium]
MNKATLVVIILFLAALAGYLWWQQRSTLTAPTPTIQPESTNTEVPAESSELSALQQFGTTYQDPQGIFSVTYPSDYELDQPAEGQVRLIKRGEMQRPQSEISDGVLLVFETLTLEEKSLEEAVDERIVAFTANETGEIIQPKSAITIGGNQGFEYTVRSLGTSRQVLVQKDSNSEYAIAIAILIEDPQDVGYMQQVDAILSSIKFFK